MVLNEHRDKADRFLTPVALNLGGTDPNVLTWISLAFALLAGLAFYAGRWSYLVLAFLFVSANAYLDALDGKVAKLHGKATKRGDFLDHAGDRYADIFILLGIAFSPYCHLWIGLFAIIGVLMTSYMGTQAQALGLGRDYGGILGRAERLVLLMFIPLIYVLLAFFGFTHLWGYTLFDYLMALFAIAGNLTAIIRGKKAWEGLARV